MCLRAPAVGQDTSKQHFKDDVCIVLTHAIGLARIFVGSSLYCITHTPL